MLIKTASMVIVVVGCLLIHCVQKKTEIVPEQKQSVVPVPMATIQPAPAQVPVKDTLPPATTADLIGRWDRIDGGYTISIKSVSPDGKVDAGYFNPGTIKVGTAKAEVRVGVVEFVLTLDDPEKGYPGSSYSLMLDKKNNVLFGTYFQAAMNQRYEVVFTKK